MPGRRASIFSRKNSKLIALSGCVPNTPLRLLIGSVQLYRYLIPLKQRDRPAGRPAILIGEISNGLCTGALALVQQGVVVPGHYTCTTNLVGHSERPIPTSRSAEAIRKKARQFGQQQATQIRKSVTRSEPPAQLARLAAKTFKTKTKSRKHVPGAYFP